MEEDFSQITNSLSMEENSQLFAKMSSTPSSPTPLCGSGAAAPSLPFFWARANETVCQPSRCLWHCFPRLHSPSESHAWPQFPHQSPLREDVPIIWVCTKGSFICLRELPPTVRCQETTLKCCFLNFTIEIEKAVKGLVSPSICHLILISSTVPSFWSPLFSLLHGILPLIT